MPENDPANPDQGALAVLSARTIKDASPEDAVTAVEPSEFEKNLAIYRQALVTAEQAMQGEFDKAVLTLSGGALGVSFTFLKDIAGAKTHLFVWALLASWILWTVSITCVLASYFCSTKAFRKALNDNDSQTIYMTLANSWWAVSTKILNYVGGALFVIGLGCFIFFVFKNHPN